MNSSILLVFISLGLFSHAQNSGITLEKAIDLGIANNKGLQSSKNHIEMNKQLEGTAYAIDKTDIYYNFDQNNIAPNNLPLSVFGISQAIRFPSFYASQKKVLAQQTKMSEYKYQMDEKLLKKEISKAYYTIYHWNEMLKVYTYLDSIYQKFAEGALQKNTLGESNNLELLLAQSKSKEMHLMMYQSEMNYNRSIVQLNRWIQSDTVYTISEQLKENMSLVALDTANNPYLQYLNQSIQFSEKQLSLAKNNLLPDLKLGVFQGSNNGVSVNRFYGIQAGIAIPLFYGADKAKIQASKTDLLIKQTDFENYSLQMQANYESLTSELISYKSGIDYYHDFGEKLFSETLLNANTAYQSGEIDYLQYITLLEHANTIKLNYLQNNFFYNLTVIEANNILN